MEVQIVFVANHIDQIAASGLQLEELPLPSAFAYRSRTPCSVFNEVLVCP